MSDHVRDADMPVLGVASPDAWWHHPWSLHSNARALYNMTNHKHDSFSVSLVTVSLAVFSGRK